MNTPPRAPSLRSEHVPRPGDVVGAKYRVERVLAIGGMGAVLAASHVELGHRVAVKVMLPGLLDRPEFAARFFREGRAAALLRSEHAARIFDFGRLDDGVPYLVMELLDGLDLEKLVRQRGPLPVEESVGYIVQACDAIAEAHAHGIVHRDVKPSNLFVVRGRGAPSVKVLDFGISKSMEADDWEGAALTATEATLGSPAYMSPEQLRSAKGVDGRTDVWSLGLVLHWLLTARLAFEADSLGAHLAMVVNHPPTPLRVRRPDAPAALEEIILRCLQKDLARRFQSAGQLALALAPFAPPWARDLVPRVVARGGEPEAAVPLPPLEQTTTGSRPAIGHGASTQAEWTPFGTQAPRRGLRLSLQAGALLAAVLLGITAQRLLGAGPAAPPAEDAPAPAEVTAAQATTAAAPAAETTTAAQAPAEEVVPGQVAIQLVLEPPGATVEVDGVLTLDNPVRLRRGAEVHRFVVSAPGHGPQSREVSARTDAELRVSLKRQESGPSRPPPQAAPEPPPKKKLKGPMETEL